MPYNDLMVADFIISSPVADLCSVWDA